MKNIFTIRVSATSANLGCAFDVGGIALSLYNTFTFDFTQTQWNIQGNHAELNNPDHLVITTFQTILDKYKHKQPSGFALFCQCDIPMARGLGSSSSCIIAGILAADQYAGLQLSKEQILFEAVTIEGHPDNVAPALLGQMVASVVSHHRVYTQQILPHPSLRYVAIVPNKTLKTSEARTALQKSYPLEAIIFNLSRSALLLKAYESHNIEQIKIVSEDRLHQAYRLPLIEDYPQIQKITQKDPVITHWVSGSGSTIMVLISESDASMFVEQCRQELSSDIHIYLLHPDREGAKIMLQSSLD